MIDPASEIIEGDESPVLPPARPAATLVVMAERGDGAPPDLLFVKRSETMAFAGGAVVFPGGRVDPDDLLVAHQYASSGDDVADLASRVAAIRETLEETGLLTGVIVHDNAVVADGLRQGLHAGEPWSALLHRHGIALDLTALTPFARWIPKLNNPRRFDTRFYVVKASAEQRAAYLTVDQTENSALFWASAAGALEMAAAGGIAIIFPTRRNLERLAQYRDFADALDCATRHPPTIISPWIEYRGEARFLVIPSGLGYPVTDEPLATAARS
jgi:8-oxo-dGTP pyrophosphatase MutT (NUDIX family)